MLCYEIVSIHSPSQTTAPQSFCAWECIHMNRCVCLCLCVCVFIHRVHCYSSHLCQRLGDYVSDWHMLGFTSIGLLLHWLKTWLLIFRQLYQGSNGQTIRLTDRDKRIKRRKRDRDTERMGWKWMILIVMGISAVFPQNCDAKNLNLPLTHFHTHTLKNTHMFLNYGKKIYGNNFAIKTFIIAQKLHCLHSLLPRQ